MYEIMFYLRGDFNRGDTLEFVAPGDGVFKVTINEMYDEEDNAIDRAAKAMMVTRLRVPIFVAPGSVIRKRKAQED